MHIILYASSYIYSRVGWCTSGARYIWQGRISKWTTGCRVHVLRRKRITPERNLTKLYTTYRARSSRALQCSTQWHARHWERKARAFRRMETRETIRSELATVNGPVLLWTRQEKEWERERERGENLRNFWNARGRDIPPVRLFLPRKTRASYLHLAPQAAGMLCYISHGDKKKKLHPDTYLNTYTKSWCC